MQTMSQLEVVHADPRLNYYTQAAERRIGLRRVKQVAHVHKHFVNNGTYLTLVTRITPATSAHEKVPESSGKIRPIMRPDK